MIKNNFYLLLVLVIFQGCGFSSGLYKDILEAQEYIKTQNFEKAIQTYEKILEKKPAKQIQLKIEYQLGDIYSIYMNEYKKALVHFKNYLSLSEDPRIQVAAIEKIALIYFENLKDYNKALDYYKKLIQFEPPLERSDFYHFKYAEAKFYLKDFKGSEKNFKELSQSGKNEYSVQSYYYLGLIHFYKENWDVAVNYWFEYLKREKRKDKIVHTKFLIANAYESSEDLKKAYNIYYSIIGEYPNPEIIKSRLKSLYERRVARKR